MRCAMVARASETGGPCYKARRASAAAAGSSGKEKKQVVGWLRDKTQQMCNLYIFSEPGLMLQVPEPGIKQDLSEITEL